MKDRKVSVCVGIGMARKPADLLNRNKMPNKNLVLGTKNAYVK